jgi:hypothetical protein
MGLIVDRYFVISMERWGKKPEAGRSGGGQTNAEAAWESTGRG